MDNFTGEIAESAGEYGSTHHGLEWPFMIGLTCMIVVLGAAIAWWVLILALPIVAVAVIGWVYEYNRGDRALIIYSKGGVTSSTWMM